MENKAMLFSNIYNLNGFGNGSNMFLQGFGMLGGGGGFSCGSFGGSVFSNCNGDINFDKMAGFGVANALMNVGFMAAGSLINTKEPKIDNSKKLKNITSELASKQRDKSRLENLEKDYNSKLQTATTTKSKLEQELQSITLSSLESDFEQAKATYEADKNPTNKAALDNAEKALKEAKKKQEKLESDIKQQNEIINDTTEKIQNINDKISTLTNEIKSLEYKQEFYNKNLQPQQENQVLDKADGNWIERKLGGESGKLRTTLRQYRKLKQDYDKNPNEETAKLLYNLGKNSIPQYDKLAENDKKEFSSAMGIIKKTQDGLLRKYPNITNQ